MMVFKTLAMMWIFGMGMLAGALWQQDFDTTMLLKESSSKIMVTETAVYCDVNNKLRHQLLRCDGDFAMIEDSEWSK